MRFYRLISFVAGGFVGLPALAQSPIAEMICAPTAQMEQKLTVQFGTQRTARGVRSPEQIMEVWASPKGRWTLVVTYASGTSCIVAMGEDWDQNIAAKARG